MKQPPEDMPESLRQEILILHEEPPEEGDGPEGDSKADWSYDEGPRGVDRWVNAEGDIRYTDPAGASAEKSSDGDGGRELSGKARAALFGGTLFEKARTALFPKADDDEGDGEWRPYQGPRGGSGWENTATGERIYQDEPPGELDLSGLEEYELVNVAHERFGLTEGQTRDMIDDVDTREEFEDLVASELRNASEGGVDHRLPEDIEGAMRDWGMQPEMAMMIQAVREDLGGDAGLDELLDAAGDAGATGPILEEAEEALGPLREPVGGGASPGDGPGGIVTAGDVSEGDEILIDGVGVEVDRVSDMGGGFYIAGRGDDGEVHTARVGPSEEFGVPAEDDGAWGSAGFYDIAAAIRNAPTITEDVERAVVGGADGPDELRDLAEEYLGPGKLEEVRSRLDGGGPDEPLGPLKTPEDYDVSDDGFDRELAEAVTSGEMLGTDAVYRNMGKVDDPELVADALELELRGKDRKTARERLEGKLGTFDDGPTAGDVRGRLKSDGPAGGGSGGGYPSDVYDSAEEELERLPPNSNSVTGTTPGFHGVKRGEYDLDALERFHEHAETETLERIVSNADTNAAGRPYDDKAQMAAGLLHYREDSGMDWEDAMDVDLSPQRGVSPAEEIRKNAGESFDRLNPAVGALTMTHIETFKSESSSKWAGVWRPRSQTIAIDSDENFGMSSTKHEIGHAMQYALGVAGDASRDNTSGRGSNPGGWEFNFGTGTRATEKAVNLSKELEEEAEKFRERATEYNEYNAQCRAYQQTNANEFIAVTFQHWQNDRAKLERVHPEMADLWDRHVGDGRKETEEATVSGGSGELFEEDLKDERVDVQLAGVNATLPSEITNARVLRDGGNHIEVELGPESYKVSENSIESLGVRGGLPEEGPTNYKRDITPNNANEMGRGQLEAALAGERVDVEYESVTGPDTRDDMEFQRADMKRDEPGIETLWFRDPRESGPASEFNVPIDDLERIRVRDE